MPVTTPAPYRLGSATRTSSTRFAILSWYLIGSRSSGVISSCLVAHCRHETERTLVPGYSFRKCVPTGVGSNLGFDASPLGAWLVRRSTLLTKNVVAAYRRSDRNEYPDI